MFEAVLVKTAENTPFQPAGSVAEPCGSAGGIVALPQLVDLFNSSSVT